MSLAETEKALAKDPVCGMSVDPATARHRFEHEGTTYYFCCAGCQTKFAADPARYLDPKAAPAARARRRDLHLPDGPGGAPGRARAFARSAAWRSSPRRRPRKSTPNAELIDMKRRLGFALALTIPLVVLDMGGHLLRPDWLSPQLSNWIEFALATPVALGAGWPFFVRAWASLRTRNLNMFTLIATGVGVAWTYSVVATVAPGLFPHDDRPRRAAGLFRGVGRHHAAGDRRAGAGADGAGKDRRRHPRAPRPRAEARPARRRRRPRPRGGARRGRGRRPPARAPGRKNPGRRRGGRRRERGRRSDDDRRSRCRQ